MRYLLILLFLPSCAGFEISPSVSFETKDGEKISAKVKIKPVKNSK